MTVPIGAIVLAAGMSKRMGVPKLVLPWGTTTIIGHVVQNLQNVGVTSIIVVTGGAHQEVADALESYPVTITFNEQYPQDQMIQTLQCGIKILPEKVLAALVVLGDQPQSRLEVVKALVDEYMVSRAKIIFPSDGKRRGHPWMIDRSLWEDILVYSPAKTMRDFFRDHEGEIRYLIVGTDSIFQDIDTSGDYEKYKPR